eukprot:14911422-Alexandrium_andersonii.AAC.1
MSAPVAAPTGHNATSGRPASTAKMPGGCPSARCRRSHDHESGPAGRGRARPAPGGHARAACP